MRTAPAESKRILDPKLTCLAALLLLAACAEKKASPITDAGPSPDGLSVAEDAASSDGSSIIDGRGGDSGANSAVADGSPLAVDDGSMTVDVVLSHADAATDATADVASAVDVASTADVTPDGRVAALPLDLYIMFDQSGSMLTKDDGITARIDVVRGAMGEFLHAPESQGLGAGIGFFGFQPLMCMCTSCNPADYATPKVPVAPLPQQADAIAMALANVEPIGETPTGPALRGACDYAAVRRQSAPDRRIAILLVTDGLPQTPLSKATTCNATLPDAVAAAQDCLARGVQTYVLGVGPALDNLGQIAAAGGTTHAYLAANAARQAIIELLTAIRADARP